MNTKIILRIIGAVLATGIGLYPAIYFIAGHHFGILQSKNVAVLNNVFWNIGFYNHILFGGIALLTGWTQFNSNWRNKKLDKESITFDTEVFRFLAIAGKAGKYMSMDKGPIAVNNPSISIK